MPESDIKVVSESFIFEFFQTVLEVYRSAETKYSLLQNEKERFEKILKNNISHRIQGSKLGGESLRIKVNAWITVGKFNLWFTNLFDSWGFRVCKI